MILSCRRGIRCCWKCWPRGALQRRAAFDFFVGNFIAFVRQLVGRVVLVFNLRAKLDAAGHYDDFEVDRVVAVELNPSAKQSELVAALEPVQDRLMKRYKAAQAALKPAGGRECPAVFPSIKSHPA